MAQPRRVQIDIGQYQCRGKGTVRRCSIPTLRSTSKRRGLGSSREALSRAASHLSLFLITDKDNLHRPRTARVQRFQGLVPNKHVVGLVYSAAYIEDYSKSPLCFQPFDCSSVGLYIDGQSYPTQHLQPNYGADQFVDCYRTLTIFRKDVDVSRDDFKKVYCLYVLDVEPYYSFNTKRKCHCRLELKFSIALPGSVTLIMYAVFPEILHINQARAVFLK